MKITATADMFADERRSLPEWLQNTARKLVFSRLNDLRDGTVTVQEGDNVYTFGRPTDICRLHVKLTVHSPLMYWRIISNGSIGAGEAYMQGLWSCSDLTGLLRIFVLNRETLLGMEKGLARLTRPLLRAWHLANRNSRDGSRRNIQAHYDIGNDFYQLFLDRQMMYSSAVYPSDDADLEKAASYKVDAVCSRLQLKPGDHLLEIGSGWGGLAIHAARYYGCRVTTVTISEEQYELARRRVKDQGLAHRITVLKKDYRDLTGCYDKLVSIEMIEAVGPQYYGGFFETCSRLLTDDGLALIQAITINDQLYDQARRDVDFIQRYIFPGGSLPSVSVIMEKIRDHSDMRLLHMVDFAEHYARTLKDWRARFTDKLEAVRSMGYPDTFIRMWEFYLCYCEAGFAERSIGVSQFLFAKPLNRRDMVIR